MNKYLPYLCVLSLLITLNTHHIFLNGWKQKWKEEMSHDWMQNLDMCKGKGEEIERGNECDEEEEEERKFEN